MSNKIANLKLNLTYTGPNGETVVVPTQQVNAPYQGFVAGTIDVPDSEASSTVHAVSFGSIGVAATLVVIINGTGQELGVKINGAAAVSHHVANGGVLVLGDNAAPGSVPVTSLSLTTTAMQAGAGQIAYYAFGDPT